MRSPLPGLIPGRSRLHRNGHELLDALLELVAIPVVACAADGRLTHANRHARELIGECRGFGTYPDTWVRELRPRTPSGLPMPLEDLPAIRALHGEIVRSFDVLVSLGGGDVLLETCARPATDRRGRPRGAIVTLQDVTERRRREALLRVRAAG
ncbi:MAG: PAS domain-containing protein [Solirubrobacteraceae bacterium]